MLIRTISRILATAWEIAAAALNALLFDADLTGSALTVVTTIDTATIGANPTLTTVGIDPTRRKACIGTGGIFSTGIGQQAGVTSWATGGADWGWRLDTSVEGREAKNESDAG